MAVCGCEGGGGDTFYLTKRPERIGEHLPADWGDGWESEENT